MIRIRPYEWLHMEVKGSGTVGRKKAAGTLYITPHRVTIQGREGPEWSAPVKSLSVSARGSTGRLETPEGHRIEWKSKTPPAWWCNAVLFWKAGVITGTSQVDGAPPSFGNVEELPDILRQTKWSIRWYDRESLEACGIQGTIPDTEEFDRVCRRTNIILAALRHDGFPDGPPPAYYRIMLRRHALADITHTVWAWREGLRYITNVIAGKGSDPKAYNNYKLYAGRPDRWYEPKPIAPKKKEWHHELNPASCGGHPYQIRERCRSMIPVAMRVADELHETPSHNPYLRMRQIYEAVRDGRDLPPPPREALPLARTATDNPW